MCTSVRLFYLLITLILPQTWLITHWKLWTQNLKSMCSSNLCLNKDLPVRYLYSVLKVLLGLSQATKGSVYIYIYMYMFFFFHLWNLYSWSTRRYSSASARGEECETGPCHNAVLDGCLALCEPSLERLQKEWALSFALMSWVFFST